MQKYISLIINFNTFPSEGKINEPFDHKHASNLMNFQDKIGSFVFFQKKTHRSEGVNK